MKALLKNASVFTDGVFVDSDLYIEDGIVRMISPRGAILSDFPEGVAVFDFSGKFIFPGFVDVHVHFREPGFSYKETIRTGSLAAAHGGYTDVCTMPNLSPVPDCAEHIGVQKEIIDRTAVINVYPYGSLTVGAGGQKVSDFESMQDIAIAFSDDGVGVHDDEVMREAFMRAKALGKKAVAHCEFKPLMVGSNINDGRVAAALDTQGITDESEWKMIERDIALARETGAAYHVCHVSTAQSVKLIRDAKAAGVDITCETGPHYLLLDEEVMLEGYRASGDYDRLEEEINRYSEDKYRQFAGSEEAPTKEDARKGLVDTPERLGRFKMNPPLRSVADREELLAGLLDGTIDMIATDHAPHSLEEKSKGLFGGPMGVVGLECAFPVMYTGFVKSGKLTLERLVELMSTVPAQRFGIESGIKQGGIAKLCVYDLEDEYTVNPSEFLTQGRFTPFEGARVFGRCLMTVCGDNVCDYR